MHCTTVSHSDEAGFYNRGYVSLSYIVLLLMMLMMMMMMMMMNEFPLSRHEVQRLKGHLMVYKTSHAVVSAVLR